MATFHRCDRCKKEAHTTNVSFPIFSKYSSSEQLAYDLCKSCEYSFEKWLKDGQKVSE